MSEPGWFVDRIEGEFAVLCGENGRCWDLPRWLLPAGAREGTYLRLRIEIDAQETESRRAEVWAVLERLRSRDAGGDLKL